jgi:hypothetical protein
MKRRFLLLAMVAALVLGHGQAVADFYVIGGSGGLGTRITSLPFTIINPGFYYLAGNLTAPDPGGGITVNANNVTIDLMGFSLIGTNQTYDGIQIPYGYSNVEIRNGTIRDCSTAISAYALSSVVTSHRIFHMRVFNNMEGITLNGIGNTVSNCTVDNPMGPGISTMNSLRINNVSLGSMGFLGTGNTSIGNHPPPP